ncbi:MAG: choice-of-anchor R domain-containing protein [Chloroflexota bacterium]|nr:choice-of-anchor R domain-containing protein [Chloroflexota bacterium]
MAEVKTRNHTGSEAFTVEIERRDFSGPVTLGLRVKPVRLSWSAFGGPAQATCRAVGPAGRLLDLTGLLRCGVTVRDGQGEPVWWGFIEAVEVNLAAVSVRVALADLANRVRVQYQTLSAGRLVGVRATTKAAEDLRSQAEYGVKEHLLTRQNIDRAFAESLRDTWLAQHAWPITRLSQRTKPGAPQARLICKGWFETLGWRTYGNAEGFYANDEQGPGTFAFGNSAGSRYVGQSFAPGEDVDLKTVHFRLRNVGGAARAITARVHTDAGGVPGAVVATSGPLDPVGLPDTAYGWAQFSFDDPVALSGGHRYWVSLDPNGVNSGAYFMLRIDENMGFAGGEGRYYNQSTGTWNPLPPADRPDTLFRFVGIADTGVQIGAVAARGGQFFPRISTLTTGLETSPYRAADRDCLAEAKALMALGTQHRRLVLASVSSRRDLRFFTQPDPAEADVYLDRQSRFYTHRGVVMRPWPPPVGRYARLAATNEISLPWDRRRVPACFIAGAAYEVPTGRLRIRTMGEG